MRPELNYRDNTLIMGILNLTPDSFYDGGHFFDKGKAIDHAYQLEKDGADILDIGGESTRPGAVSVSIQEEIDRVCPVIEELSKNIRIPISIDTYKSEVAEQALKLGVSIVNDISALAFDDNMADLVSRYKAYIILMHMKGIPKTMQVDPKYENLLEEIYEYLNNAKDKAVKHGILNEKIIIDPGIGFGKTVMDNYKIISNIGYFKKIGMPILIGLSMKSLVGNLYDGNYDRLPATVALNSISVVNGADIIRVHDVERHRLALIAVEKLKKVN